ncbi:MAG: hypothetical protein EOO05_06175 [Chitinophagaceae bacterium]|nr:MAG: hypothetical protein EOO05_06175 [Chitinophagaceae bacterium]
MASFHLILKNDKRKFYKSFSIFILVLNALAICLFLYYLPQTVVQQASAIICVVLSVSVIVYREKMKSSRFTEAGIYAVMAALTIYWAFIGYWWAAVVVLVLALLYRFANKIPEVIVTDQHVVYPSFPMKLIPWNSLSNLVLKDGLLTIDFRNNKIIQQLLDPAAKSPDEQEINDFCRIQIGRAR